VVPFDLTVFPTLELEMSEASNSDDDVVDSEDDSYWYGYDCNISFSDDDEY